MLLLSADLVELVWMQTIASPHSDETVRIEIMQGTQAGSKAVFNPNLNERSIASTKAVDDSVARSDSSRNVVNTHNVL